MAETVIYRHIMNRAPTLADRAKKIGLKDFIEKLEEQGWARDDVILKNFIVRYRGNSGNGNNYIEWSAELSDN